MFRAREISTIERLMIEKGVETKAGIGKHLLEKLVLYGYGGTEATKIRVYIYDGAAMADHILFEDDFGAKILEAFVASLPIGQDTKTASKNGLWQIYFMGGSRLDRSEFISPFDLTGKRYRENV